jgi:hypothetical protein
MIDKRQEQITNLETEIQGIMKEIALEQETNSRLIDTEDKFKKEGTLFAQKIEELSKEIK